MRTMEDNYYSIEDIATILENQSAPPGTKTGAISKVDSTPGAGVIRTTRDVPPADYKLQIQSFSVLSRILEEEKLEKYESDCFEASGYKWRLALYPYGDTDGSAKGYISLYLVLCETNALPIGLEVVAGFRFFVYDQIRDKYLVIEDSNERVRRFHKMKTEYGISHLISLAAFNNVFNGYLVNDRCVFGVEVQVIKNTSKAECVSFINEPNFLIPRQYKLPKFSTHCKEYYGHDTLRKEKIIIFPRGYGSQKGKNLSLFFSLEVSAFSSRFRRLFRRDNNQEKKVYVECKMRVKDQLGGQHMERMGRQWCNSEGGAIWRFENFMSLESLHDPSRGFLVNDTLSVEVELRIIFTVNDAS